MISTVAFFVVLAAFAPGEADVKLFQVNRPLYLWKPVKQSA